MNLNGRFPCYRSFVNNAVSSKRLICEAQEKKSNYKKKRAENKKENEKYTPLFFSADQVTYSFCFHCSIFTACLFVSSAVFFSFSSLRLSLFISSVNFSNVNGLQFTLFYLLPKIKFMKIKSLKLSLFDYCV